MEETILPTIRKLSPRNFSAVFVFLILECATLTEKIFSFTIFEKWKKIMLCPCIPLVSAYIYQVKNDKYANSFCHNKISGNGSVL